MGADHALTLLDRMLWTAALVAAPLLAALLIVGVIISVAASLSSRMRVHAPSPKWRMARVASSLTPLKCAPMTAPRSLPSAVR